MFNLSGIMEKATEPLSKPLPYDTPTDDQVKRLEEFLRQPFELMTITKKPEMFAVPQNLFTLSIKAPAEEGARPVAVLNFNAEGWDRLSYEYLQGMAKAARKDPKSIPRSMRPFAKLMDRLPESPTGNNAVDSGRRVVIEKNIEAIAPGIRNILEMRLREWRP